MALAVQRTTAVSDAVDGDYVPLHTDALGRLQVSGTQLEDAVAASGDAGHFVLAVRRDAPTSGAAAGDYHELGVDALGRLWTSGTYAEDSVAVTADYGKFVLAVRRDTPTSGAAAGDYHEFEVDALGRLWVTGTQAEDAVAGSGDTGHFMLAVRRDAPTSGAAAGDYHEISVDALGRLWTVGAFAEDAASAGGEYGIMGLNVRRDVQVSSGTTDGDFSTFNTDAFGRLRVSDRNEATVAATTALATNVVVKASAGKLFGFVGYSTTAQFIQLHNTTSLPADTAVPVLVFPIEANKPFSISLERPHPCSTGITLCNSTTGPTKTIGAADTWITAYYE
jgi:hypothetical protein